MATNELSKEMVDLVMKVKRHLRDNYEITIALADPQLFDKLIALKNVDDTLLQGMLRYLMALAGPEWTAKYEGLAAAPEAIPAANDSKSIKKFFSFYRGKPIPAADGEKTGSEPATEEGDGDRAATKTPVRYYRGQPIYDD
jgi:hypothetical protein